MELLLALMILDMNEPVLGKMEEQVRAVFSVNHEVEKASDVLSLMT